MLSKDYKKNKLWEKLSFSQQVLLFETDLDGNEIDIKVSSECKCKTWTKVYYKHSDMMVLIKNIMIIINLLSNALEFKVVLSFLGI